MKRNKQKLEIIRSIDLLEFLDYKDYLKALFQHLKSDLKRYSYVQFSEDLGLSYTNVSWMIIAGKRKITRHTFEKIASSLDIKGIERKYFAQLIKLTNSRKAEDHQQNLQELLKIRSSGLSDQEAASQLEYLSEWYNPVIREMVGLKEFYSEPKWIVSKLYSRLLPRQIEGALKLLEKMDLIKYSNNRMRHLKSDKQVLPDEKIAKIGSAGYHQKMMEVAIESITKVPTDRRDLNALTICIAESDFPKLKEIVYKACEEIMKLEAESRDPDQVFQVNIHAFPLTKS